MRSIVLLLLISTPAAAMSPCGQPLHVYHPAMWAPMVDLRSHDGGYGLGTGFLYAPDQHDECRSWGYNLDVEAHSKDGALVSLGYGFFEDLGARFTIRLARQIAPDPKYALVTTLGFFGIAVSLGVEGRRSDDLHAFLGASFGGGAYGALDHIEFPNR